jgi:hypothetical protein
MTEGGDSSGKIKVVDRRRFNDDGELRPDRDAGETKAPAEPKRPAAAAAEPGEGGEAPSRPSAERPPPNAPASAKDTEADASASATQAPASATSPLFMDLVNDLAQQAALLLQGAEGIPAQPEHAQRLIDYLGVIESKTRGNLSAEESQFLSSVVYQLRSAFVATRS